MVFLIIYIQSNCDNLNKNQDVNIIFVLKCIKKKIVGKWTKYNKYDVIKNKKYINIKFSLH